MKVGPSSIQNVVGLLLFCVLLTLPIESASADTLTETLKAEAIEDLAKDAREKGDPIRGAILFPQQSVGCANCHIAGNNAAVGPDLTRLDKKPTDVSIVESILSPSKVIKEEYKSSTIVMSDGVTWTGRIIREGENSLVIRDIKAPFELHTLGKGDIDEQVTNTVSSMPEKLADQLKDRQQFLDLVRYVMEISATGSPSVQPVSGGGKLVPRLHGVVLLQEHNCAVCHSEAKTEAILSAKSAPDLMWSAKHNDPAWLQRYIADPQTTKHGAAMPDLLSELSEEQRTETAQAITHFLMSKTEQQFNPASADAGKAASGRELFHSIGCVACHSPRGDDHVELLPKSSIPLGHPGDKYSIDGLTAFLKTPHAVRSSGRMPSLKLSADEAANLAHYLIGDRTTEPSAKPLDVDPQLVKDGELAFRTHNCAQCHSGVMKVEQFDVPITDATALETGCLSGKKGKWPLFSLADDERDAIQQAMSVEELTLTDEEQISVTLHGMRCTNCHQRGELGGVSIERNPHFKTTNPNLGPQGRLPPTLTNVGAKLQPKWMRQVLVSGRAIRPYVRTRMPMYQPQHVAPLIDLLQKVDEMPTVEFAEFDDQKLMRQTGHTMVGSKGLNCIACHTYRLQESPTMSAVDLTEMAQRLQKPWFYHYMKAPQSLSQNTVMPSFWPGGRTLRKEFLDGDPDMQIEAIWQYLKDGRQARQPQGVVIEPIELLATDEAVMLRRKYPGVGKRGIGVGYPNQVNIVFDAEQMRLASAWAGKFADPGGVWRSQGHGSVRPLGRDVFTFPKGPDIDSIKSPWIADDGRPPKHQFLGYRLDQKRRPTFRYRCDSVTVEDKITDAIDEKTGHPFLNRVLSFESAKENSDLRLRLYSGERIVRDGETDVIIGDKLRIRTRTAASIEEMNDSQKQLYLPLRLPPGKSQVTIEYHWLATPVSK